MIVERPTEGAAWVVSLGCGLEVITLSKIGAKLNAAWVRAFA